MVAQLSPQSSHRLVGDVHLVWKANFLSLAFFSFFKLFSSKPWQKPSGSKTIMLHQTARCYFCPGEKWCRGAIKAAQSAAKKDSKAENNYGAAAFRRKKTKRKRRPCLACDWLVSCEDFSPATSRQLNHLILISCDDPGQAAGQQHANHLMERTQRHV